MTIDIFLRVAVLNWFNNFSNVKNEQRLLYALTMEF